MALKNIIKAITLTSISSGSVSGTYAAINSSGLPFGCSIIRIMNASDKDITVSYDGTHDHEYIIANNTFQLNAQNNSQPTSNVALMPAGTVVYVKGTAGTGTIYLSGYYQPVQN